MFVYGRMHACIDSISYSGESSSDYICRQSLLIVITNVLYDSSPQHVPGHQYHHRLSLISNHRLNEVKRKGSLMACL
jgi:hypothetical protein